MSKQEQSEISKQLEIIVVTQKEEKAKTDRILSYLENDPTTNQKGMVEDFYLLKDEVKGIVEKEKINLAVRTILVSIGGVLYFILNWIYEHFYKK